MDKELYQECVKQVLNDRDQFSLNEEFNSDYDNINAVTLITPTQTVSRFNDNKVGFGSGDHSKNLQTILYSVYGKSFYFENSYQDIRISYINKLKSDGIPLEIIMFFPPIITNSQIKSLININKEIKNCEQINNCVIDIFIDMNGSSLGKVGNNLDEFLYKLQNNSYNIKIVDNYELTNQELGMVGYPNEENHYNNSPFKIKQSNQTK